jgi:hypothetical protein
MNAAEVLDALDDLGAARMIPTQWGTFRLGNEPVGHPMLSLRRIMQERQFDESRVLITHSARLRAYGDEFSGSDFSGPCDLSVVSEDG